VEAEPTDDEDVKAMRPGLLDMARRALVVVGALLLVGGLALGGLRVAALYDAEIDVGSVPAPIAPTPNAAGEAEPHVELVRTEVPAGYDVLFEFCAEAQLDDAWPITLMVWNPEVQEVVLELSVEDAVEGGNIRHASWGSCVTLGEGANLPEGGLFAIEAVWPGRELTDEVRETDVVAKISGNPPLGGDDPWAVLFVLVGALALTFGVTRPGPAPAKEAEGPAPWPAVGGVVGLIVVLLVLAFVPWGGSVAAFARGLIIAGAEVVLALLLIPRLAELSRTQRLGLLPPRRLWMIALAPAVGIVLFVVGRLLAAMIPSTSEASIQTLVSFSSGALTLALISVIVPVAEEIFFRGLVFGTLERRAGGALAFGVTVLLFTLAHLPQAWGDWGAFTAILFTSVGLTGLRWWSGSTLVTILAHLAHNAIISLGSIAF